MDTKTALLDCAEVAIRSRGFDGFSYADLATLVGIRKASIHYHFPTKADLALALIKRYTSSFYAILNQIAAQHETGGRRLQTYIATCRDAIDGGNQLCLCVTFCAGRDGLSEAVLEELNHFHVTVIAWLRTTFQLGQTDGSIVNVKHPSAEAAACKAQIEGAQLIARAAKDIAQFDLATATLIGRAP
jgi:TetR/AcrR family transcriptional regulator, transcriptional repressor for nem operon